MQTDIHTSARLALAWAPLFLLAEPIIFCPSTVQLFPLSERVPGWFVSGVSHAPDQPKANVDRGVTEVVLYQAAPPVAH